MKKYLTLIMAISILTPFAYARKVDRGAFEGISAEDIRSGNISVQELQKKADAEAKSRAEARAQHAAENYNGWSSPRRGNGTFSSLGTNYFQIGGAADLVTSEGTTETGVDARIGLNFNLYKEKGNSGFGVDALIPLEYTYVDMSEGIASAEIHSFTFPIYLRPYYAIEVDSDFVIKPFVQAGVGGRYTYMEANIGGFGGSMDGLAFVWAAGGGVELCLFKDFYIQGKYLYNDSSAETTSLDRYATPEHEISVEIGYRFTHQMALIVQYSHVFWKLKGGLDGYGANLDQDKVGACLRFLF